MANKLADFVVGIGVKGQNVAMTEINKIKKAGKELSKQKNTVNFQNVRAEINARKQLDTIKRQTQATRGQTELAKMQEKRFSDVSNRAKGAAQTGSGIAATAMTAGVSGLTSSIPVVGALFGGASSSIESVGQQIIAGVTAQKNISMVEANYRRAFSGAFSSGVEKAMQSRSGAFAGLQGQAFVTSLADQGVNAKTLQGAVPALNQLAKSQGVGSIDELMGRLQGGTLKEGAGLSKADITLLQSQSQLLNNRFTSDIGAQMITQTLQRLAPQLKSVADTKNMSEISRGVSSESLLQDRERRYVAGALSVYGEGDQAINKMYELRKQDREMQAFMQPLAQGVAGVQMSAGKKAKRLYESVKKGNYAEAAAEFLPGLGAVREAQTSGAGVSEGGGGEGPQGPTSGEGASAGPLSMQTDSVLSDILRSGQAIANTLMQINNQLNVTRAQLRRA